MRGRGGVVIGLDMDEDTLANLKSYRARHKITYPLAIDTGKKTYGRFGTQIPSSALVDSNGVIRAIQEGFDLNSHARLRRQFMNLLPAQRR